MVKGVISKVRSVKFMPVNGIRSITNSLLDSWKINRFDNEMFIIGGLIECFWKVKG